MFVKISIQNSILIFKYIYYFIFKNLTYNIIRNIRIHCKNIFKIINSKFIIITFIRMIYNRNEAINK